jgi:hypothetical protein
MKKALLFCLICLLISSCNYSGEATASVLPSMESTPSATEILLPATTSTPTIPAIFSTMTFMPTLPALEAEATILNLLDNNSGCRLPCFLGIVPGLTNELEAISFLRQFDKISPTSEIKFRRDDLLVSLDVTAEGGYNETHPEIVKWVDANMMVYRQLETKIDKIYGNPYYAESFRNYTLPYLLSTYGPPDQAYVYLDTGIADMGLGLDLYLLHLDYSSQGWVAHLEMPLYRKGNLYLGCPSEAFTNLRLWSPDNPARDFELDSDVLFTTEEASGLTLEEFYQKFKDPSNTTCLETPANIQK